MRILKKLSLNIKTGKRKRTKREIHGTCSVTTSEGRRVKTKMYILLVMERIQLLLLTKKIV